MFALKCSFVYFTFVFDMHSAQIKTFRAQFTDKESLFSLDEIMDAKVLVVFLIVLVLALCAARKGRYLNID